MDTDKSLYMTEFLKMREDLGKITLYPVKDTLFTNIYGELKPRKHIKAVEEIIEEIEEKTINIVKKGANQHLFTDVDEGGLGKLDILDTEDTDDTEDTEDIKLVKVNDTIATNIEDLTKKTITFDPSYDPN